MSTPNEPNNSPTPTAPDPSLISSETKSVETPSTTDPAKPAEPVAAEPAKAEAPIEFVPLTETDITMPEGMEALPDAQKKFLEIVNDQSLSPKDRANQLVALQADVMKGVSEKINSMMAEQWETWQNEVRALPEYNTPEKLEPALGRISKLIDEYGSPEVREVLTLTGAGNHKALVTMFDKMAKALSEGTPVAGGVPSSSGDPEADRARRLFPSMKS